MRTKIFARATYPFHTLLLAIFAVVFTASAEIKDVTKSSEIDAVLAKSKQGEQALHPRPNFGIWAGVREGKAAPAETRADAGTVLHIRKGAGKFTVAGKAYEIGAGDVLHIARNAPFQLDPRGGRVEYLAIRVFKENPSRSTSS